MFKVYCLQRLPIQHCPDVEVREGHQWVRRRLRSRSRARQTTTPARPTARIAARRLLGRANEEEEHHCRAGATPETNRARKPTHEPRPGRKMDRPEESASPQRKEFKGIQGRREFLEAAAQAGGSTRRQGSQYQLRGKENPPRRVNKTYAEEGRPPGGRTRGTGPRREGRGRPGEASRGIRNNWRTNRPRELVESRKAPGVPEGGRGNLRVANDKHTPGDLRGSSGQERDRKSRCRGTEARPRGSRRTTGRERSEEKSKEARKRSRDKEDLKEPERPSPLAQHTGRMQAS